jgi:acyl-CoA oxidase
MFKNVHDAWGEGTKLLDLTWQKSILDHTTNYRRSCTPIESSNCLREFIKRGLLKFDDMNKRPERFFAAHRLLASKILGGFGIRFTVQFNLFAGSILGLGDAKQIQLLDTMQNNGDLGCFALTEVGAGVLSGFIVETTATYDPSFDEFIISTPTPKAEKNWISQGMTADYVVVFANLIMGTTNYGPHPFLIKMRKVHHGPLISGITITDMGRKSIANDLDNARIKFDNVRVPSNGLLKKFCKIENGVYTQTGKETMRIEVIGQRLLTGRLAIAESAIVSVRQLFIKAKKYADNKKVHGISGLIPLSHLPHLKKLFYDADNELTRLETFSASVEARLASHLRNGSIPNNKLVEALSVCKIKNIATATELQHRLEQEVGSYALMFKSGFIYKDMLLCCKFAEGDSRILLLKIARDEMKRIQKGGAPEYLKLLWDASFSSNIYNLRRARAALTLARSLYSYESMVDGFNQEWELVYQLGHCVCDCHIHNDGPDDVEISRMLRKHSHLVDLTIQPLLVSRL